MTTQPNVELREAIEKVLVKNYLPNKLAGRKLYGEYVDVVLDLLDVFQSQQQKLLQELIRQWQQFNEYDPETLSNVPVNAVRLEVIQNKLEGLS